MGVKYTSNMDEIKRRLLEAIEKATNEIGITGTAELQSNAPIDSGNLKRSLSFKKANKGSKYTITWGTSISYAPYTEFRNNTSKGWMRDTLNRFSSEAQDILIKHLKKVGK